MKLSELLQKTEDIQNGATLREVNAIYMANREEFETTTVCDQNGKVTYVVGKPPEAVVRSRPPAWKVRAMDAKVKSMEWAYRIK